MTKIEAFHGILLFIVKITSTEKKEIILKNVRKENLIVYKGKSMKITDFSTENLKARRALMTHFKH
jgi:hypothetical protein